MNFGFLGCLNRFVGGQDGTLGCLNWILGFRAPGTAPCASGTSPHQSTGVKGVFGGFKRDLGCFGGGFWDGSLWF